MWRMLLLLLVITVTGCASRQPAPAPVVAADPTPQPTSSDAPKTAVQAASVPRAVVATPVQPERAQPAPEFNLSALLHDQHNEWRGTRYRLGGLSKSGIDCSGFVHLTFLDRLGVDLPRSTYYQVKQGTDVTRRDLTTGDLVFFRTGRYNPVGIYLENGHFLHASTRAGVKISRLNDPDWRRAYWTARRLPLPDNVHLSSTP